jgi:hypothetical protein
MTSADVITRMLHAIDSMDWTALRDCFTNPVHMDYTSLWGGEPQTRSVDDLTAEWAEFAAGFGATQHLTGPVLITGDQAGTHVIAYHWRPGTGQAWTVHGHYRARLAGGRIAELTLHTFHAEGDPTLPSIPAKRAASTPQPR